MTDSAQQVREAIASAVEDAANGDVMPSVATQRILAALASVAQPGVVGKAGSLDEAIDNPAVTVRRLSRDYLGRLVREAWVRWAEQQPSPKPTWLVPYDQLSEADKEADRQIGVDLARIGAETWVADQRFNLRAALAAHPSPVQGAASS